MRNLRGSAMKTTAREFLSIKSEDEARQYAIDWQNWQAEQALSMTEVTEWQQFFETLGDKWHLTDEFKENGII